MHTIVCIWHKAVKTFICNQCAYHFARVQEYLKILNTPFVLNPRMVRGLDYYTRTVFEAVSPKLGAQNAVTAGGRYDHLMRDIGGPDIPGIGFAMGIERIVLLVPDKGETARFPNLFIAALGEEAQVRAFEVANRLHREGIKAEIDYEGRAILRYMEKKVQEEISLDQAMEEMKRRG